ncbi:M16 family metallopeptidase [Flavivirga spongiicola]|uniref:Insulinase family protein n=1 Tax=Flavivirga spongiicola TaxID=421621 RepID=A0ABU7XR21_9FLAO|nr:insulinase family protein [Flavivirga sp. MEBiC05379]MDO5978216.1 insulinase family protein [Flavivirga sp. MEBiC05379]
MQSILSVISFLLIINVLLLLFSVNSNAQSLNINDSLQTGQTIKKGILKNVKKIEEDTVLMPYMDSFIGKTLISGLTIKEGNIVSENMLQATGSTTFTLSNGIKIHYKFADKNKNDVQLKAISYGGLSLVKDNDLPSAQFLGDMMSLSGLGYYSATDLSKILTNKTVKTDIHLSNLTESICSTSTTKDFETLMQMIHLHFVNPRFDTDAYQELIRNLKNNITQRNHIINEKIKDSVTATLYGNNNPKQRLLNNDFIKEVSFDKIKTLYMERFNNAADFEFFIVGDLQKRALRPLLEKYMASIPTNGAKEIWQDNSVPWLQDTIDKDILLPMEPPKSVVRIGYQNTMSYSLKNELIARVLGEILQLRLTEILREETGGTHSVSAKANISKRPVEQASLQIAFDCNPNREGQFITIVNQEVEKIVKGVISQADLDKTRTNYLKERKKHRGYNSYDMHILTNYFREGYNMNDPKNFEDILNTILIKDLEVFTKALIKESKSYKIVFNPGSNVKK